MSKSQNQFPNVHDSLIKHKVFKSPQRPSQGQNHYKCNSPANNTVRSKSNNTMISGAATNSVVKNQNPIACTQSKRN